MFDRLKKLFDQGSEANPLSILPTPSSSPQEWPKSVLTTSPESAEIKRRAELILQSAKPEWLFLIGKKMDQGVAWMSFRHPPDKNALLLFTSIFAARDYIRHNSLECHAVGMKFEDIQKNAANWAAGGFSSFTLNRCPRCSFIQTVGIQTLSNPDGLRTLWAIAIALQRWRAERVVHGVMAKFATPEARRDLEFLRDHVDCGNPYVHQVIALRARAENDQGAFQLSLQRLREFGPQFSLSVLDAPCSETPSVNQWAADFSKATIGLLGSYGLLKLPNTTSSDLLV